MEQHDGAAVRNACGRNVHVGHADILSVERQRQEGDRVRIRNIFVGDAAGLDVRGSLRQRERVKGGTERESRKKSAGDHVQTSWTSYTMGGMTIWIMASRQLGVHRDG